MPKPAAGIEEKHPTPSAAVIQSDENNEEEDEVSEDDWDAFQSFPVSKNEAGDDSKTDDSPEDKYHSVVERSDMEGS
ncbi:HEAT repeat-containing protein 5B-like, partial [Trifolium medium]|nr:HEAT repeat-containing protein 5B-like [Trifolium medium]